MATSVQVRATQPVPFLVSSSGLQMQVRKRNGSLEPADVNKIVRAVERCCAGLHSVDPIRIASKRLADSLTEQRRRTLNLICFACCIEGLFFFAAFAYVYFLRSRGLLHGLATGTNWVFRDESAHIQFALQVSRTVRAQEPGLFDKNMEQRITAMLQDAVECEMAFADDVLSLGVSGLSPTGSARHRAGLWIKESFWIHGAAGRAGTHELL